MKSQRIFIPIFLIFPLLTSCHGLKFTENLLSEIMTSFDDDTADFLRHNCPHYDVIRRNLASTSPTIDVEFICENIETSSINVKICLHSECINPITCQPMKGMINQAIIKSVFVRDRSGNKSILRLPVACECLATPSLKISKCHRIRRGHH